MTGRSPVSATTLAAAILLAAAPSSAKPPTLTHLFPAGAARGQTVAVTASGSFDRWPVLVWTDGRGVAIEAGEKKGSLSVAVSADAEPGVHWLRLHDDEGATGLRPFLVGTMPEVVEAEPNDDPRNPQKVEPPSATINGRLGKRGDVDGFSLALTRGQTLVADLEANRHLGSPMDAVLQVVSPAGFVLAQNDDTIGRDPRIVFTAPADGSYTVRLFAFPATPDSSIRFAGGDAYIYRLTLTTGGFLDHAFPLAVSRDGPSTVEAIGPNVPEAARRLAVPPRDEGRDAVLVSDLLLAGTAEVRRVPYPAAIEGEPNDLAHPQIVPDRGAISGRIGAPGDRDVFLVAPKKGEKRRFRVESRAFGLALDPVLRLIDAGGKTLAESDDSRKDLDPEQSFTAPADGEYRVSVHDLNGRGGPRFAYLLSVLAPEPDFTLALASDRFDLTPGKTTSVAVTVDRKDGFSGPIEIVAEGLPDGVSANPVTSRPGDPSAKAVTLDLLADGCSHHGSFRIVGKAAGDNPLLRKALATIAGFEAKTDRPWITIRPAPDPAEPKKSPDADKK